MAYKAITTTNELQQRKSLAGVSPGLRRFIKQPEVDSASAADEDVPFTVIIYLLILHAPLMLIFLRVPWIATVHSVAILLLGLYYLINDKQPMRVSWVVAYIAGAELLWRGVDASLVWEYGKYAVLILSILILLKYRGKATIWPVLFMLLMVPGIMIMPSFNRQDVAFQLAGPVALAAASMAFSTVEFKKNDLQRLFLAIIAPSLAMAILIAFNVGTQDISFSGGGANEAVSEGIGANQVTSVLSLGSMAAFYYIFLAGKDLRVRSLMIGLFIFFVGASVLTFSRAGLWNTIGALMAGVFFLFIDRRRTLATMGVVLILGLVSYFIIFPWINNRTNGEVLVRFKDTDSTGRDLLFKVDYQLFLDNPVWGVGVGQSPYYHIAVFGYKKNTHTEYSRLLAEHGSFGVAVIVLMAAVLIARAVQRRSNTSKAISVSFTIWALLYMAHSSTLLVAPSFMFGVAAAHFLSKENEAKA